MVAFSSTILAVRKEGHLNITPKMLDFGACVLIGWLARVFASQPIRTCASKSNIFSRPTSFLQKSSCRVSSEKNILNSSVEWSRVEWKNWIKVISLFTFSHIFCLLSILSYEARMIIDIHTCIIRKWSIFWFFLKIAPFPGELLNFKIRLR